MKLTDAKNSKSDEDMNTIREDHRSQNRSDESVMGPLDTLVTDLKVTEDFVKEVEVNLSKLQGQMRKARQCLISEMDKNALSIPTDSLSEIKTSVDKGKLSAMSDLDLASQFIDFTSEVTHDQRSAVSSYLLRNFPEVPKSVLKRVIHYNKGHLAGSHLMLKGWKDAGQPEKILWTVLGEDRPFMYQMKYKYEEYRYNTPTKKSGGGAGKRDKPEDLFLPLCKRLLLELQFLHVLQLRDKRDTTSLDFGPFSLMEREGGKSPNKRQTSLIPRPKPSPRRSLPNLLQMKR